MRGENAECATIAGAAFHHSPSLRNHTMGFDSATPGSDSRTRTPRKQVRGHKEPYVEPVGSL